MYGSYAILMRMNTQTRPFEDALRRYRVPYSVVGGMQFYDRKEIKDFLGVTSKVRLVEPKTIARSEGKAKRVIDRRQG